MKAEKFLKIKNQTQNTADLFIYGDIVSSEWDRWTYEDTAPETVRSYLDEIKGKDLNIYINSGGGSVFGGLAIYNMIKRHQETGNQVTVYVDGLAGSIASVIAFSGSKLVIPKNAFLMIHKAWVTTSGNANDLKTMADTLEKLDTSILSIYEKNLKEGIDINSIQEMVNSETWLSGEEASKYFNIEVSDQLDAVACSSDYFKNYSKLPEGIIEKEEKELTASIKVDGDSIRDVLREELSKLLNEVREEPEKEELELTSIKEEQDNETEELLMKLNLL